VQFVETHAEALADGQYHLGEQGRPIGIEQTVKRSSEPIVAHMRHLLGIDTEQAIGESMHGLLLAVDWLSLDDQ
jgi:hypothetical protein